MTQLTGSKMELRNLSEREWKKRGDSFALKLFHDTAERVPAYRKFLQANGVRPSSIRTIEDFAKVPLMTKENYLKAYPLNELMPEGDISKARMISTSSGSTGVPFFWPRTEANEAEAEMFHDHLLAEFFGVDKRRTLFVNTFAMGMWVAGTTTYESLRRIAERYDITIVTPGIEIEQILNTIAEIGPLYEQVIIAGYPPFVKDVIDMGKVRGIPWAALRPRFLFAAESFSERWREHVHAIAGIEDPLSGSLNIYGTADALIVAHETPLSVLIRKHTTAKPDLHARLFGEELRIPTLAQYDPSRRYFEELPDGQLVFSAASGIPLVRYDIGDAGHLFGREAIARHFTESGLDLDQAAADANLAGCSWNLPFIAVYGRDRMTASLYGLKIYPEHVRDALDGEVAGRFVTGRFVMITKTDDAHDQFLELNVELHPHVQEIEHVSGTLQELTLAHLKKVNSEYKRLHEALGERAVPRIVCHPYNTSDLFVRKGKQQWKR